MALSFTSFKSFAILATLSLLIASCSSERYGSIQRGTSVKTKEIALAEKTTFTPIEVVESIIDESQPIASVELTEPTTTDFTTKNQIKVDEKAVSKGITTKHKLINSLNKSNAATFPLAKITLPFSFSKSAKNHDTGGFPFWLAVLLCIIPLAGIISVGFATDWNVLKMLLALLLYILFYFPGLIFSIITVIQNKDSFE